MPTLTYVGGTSIQLVSVPAAVTYSPTPGNLVVVDVYNFDYGDGVALGIEDNASGVWGTAFRIIDGVVCGDSGSFTNSGTVYTFYQLAAASGITTITITAGGSVGGVIIISEYNTTSGYWNFDLASRYAAGSGLTTIANAISTLATNLVVHGFVWQTSSDAYTFTGSSGSTITTNQAMTGGAAFLTTTAASGHMIETSAASYIFESTVSSSATLGSFSTTFSVTSGAPVNPLSLIPTSNLVGWYRADIGANNIGESGVVSLVDWSGQGNLATNAAGNAIGLSPAVINGLPALSFVYCNLFFNNPINLYTPTSDCSVFIVFQITDLTGPRSFFAGEGGSLNYWFCKDTGPQLQGADSTWAAELGAGTAVADILWHQTNMTYDGTNIFFRKDQAADGNHSPGVAFSSPVVQMGGNYGGGEETENFTGYVAEIIVYNAVLSSGNVSAVETYLQRKYFPIAGPAYRLLGLLGVGS
jgi:hypothetical protein